MQAKNSKLVPFQCMWRIQIWSIFHIKSNIDVFLFSFLVRSPWSNTYDPPLDDGALPSDRLRKLEMEANSAFDQYREM